MPVRDAVSNWNSSMWEELKHLGAKQRYNKEVTIKQNKIKSISQPSPEFSLNYSLFSATMCIASCIWILHSALKILNLSPFGDKYKDKQLSGFLAEFLLYNCSMVPCMDHFQP